jgi:hypothetical protein
MAQLFLPVEHTEADLVLAGQIAERIDSAQLYVTWTPAAGPALPEIAAELRTAGMRRPGAIKLMFQVMRELAALFIGRDPQGARMLPPAPRPGIPAPPETAA